MNRAELNGYLSVILETVADMGAEGAPSGVMYAAMQSRVSLQEYQSVLGIALQGGLVEQTAHLVTITEKGRAIVAKIAAHRAAQVSS